MSVMTEPVKKAHGGDRNSGRKFPYRPRPNRKRDTINTSGLRGVAMATGEDLTKRVSTTLTEELRDWLELESDRRSIAPSRLLRELVREAKARSEEVL